MNMQSESQGEIQTGAARPGVSVLAWALPAILILSCMLISIRITAPWQYLHDDNGAWFSATARTHLLRGLGETRGQDFFLEKATGNLRPYLHHPPFISLYLAAVFRITGIDTPAAARIGVAMLHVASMLVFAGIAGMLLGRAKLPLLWAVSVFALTPMSVFFGKMPNHEVPGLLFFNLAVLLSLCTARQSLSPRRILPALFCAWFLVPLASWHAALSGAVFALLFPFVMERERRRAFRLASGGALAAALALVAVQLLWANNWRLLPGQQESLTHWLSAPREANALAHRAGNLLEAARIGRRFFANTPWALAAGWAVWAVAQTVRRRRIAPAETAVLSVGAGTLLYCVVFSEAVRIHAYQQFYFLPFTALASAMAVSRLHGLLYRRRRAAALLLTAALAAVGILSSLRRIERLYREPAPYAVKTSGDIAAQFH